MKLKEKQASSRTGAQVFFVLIMLIFIFIGLEGFAQIDSRNQIRPDKEQNFQDPDKKKGKRIKSKKNPRFKGKKAYSNRKQVKEGRRNRAKNVDKGRTGDIAGRKVKPKKTQRTTVARPQPDPYKNRRIRTEKSRAGPPAPEVRSATKKGEKARSGDISGQKTVRQRSVKSARSTPYAQPNPYVGRKVKTEKRRAKSNTRELRSVRSVSRPSETRTPKQQSRPVTATVAPKVKKKRNVYRNHDRTGGEKSTDKDIAGRKNRTKNTRSAKLTTGGVALTAVDPYGGRKEYKEGTRFKRSRSLPASARSITKRSEQGAYNKSDVYATKRNYRSPRTTGFVKAKSVRSNSQPSGKGEKPIFGKKYKFRPTRSVSGYKSARSRRSPAPPVSISGSRKRYNQRNTYRGKDRHFGENSSTKDIAGRRLRTRNYRSIKPNGTSSGFMPYYGKSAPQGSPKKYGTRETRSAKRGGWNNSGQPILGKGRSINNEAATNHRGKMPLSSMPNYGGSREGSYSGNIPSKSLRKYSGGNESTFAGRSKSQKRLMGGGSISRMWNNDGQPIIGSGRGLYGEASSNYKGKMPLSAMPSYSGSREGSYSGNIPSKSLKKYRGGSESLYAGNKKSIRPLKGGGSITRRWNNGGQPILGSGRGAYGEASSNYKGKMPLSSMPSYSGSREGSYSGKIPSKSLKKYRGGSESLYAGNKKSIRPLKGGGSITRKWNNGGQPILGSGRGAYGEASSNYQGKMPLSSIPSYSGSREGSYAGKMKAKKPMKGGGSITRSWNNGGQPILGSGRGAYGEASSNYQGKMPLSSMPSYSGSREGSYAGKMKARKPLTGGGGSITRHWNNDEQPLPGSGRFANLEEISGYQGKMKAQRAKKGYHTENFIGGDAAVKQKNIGAAPGTEYGSRKKFLFVYMGQEGGYMRTEQLKIGQSPGTENGRRRSLSFLRIGDPTQGGLHLEVAKTSKNNNLPSDLKGTNRLRTSASPGTERGRTQSLSFWTIGDPSQGGLYREANNKRKNNNLPSDLSGKEKYRLKGAEGFNNGKSTTFSFWAIGNPTRGGLVYNPSQAKGRLHPSANYTKGTKSRNSIEEKEQPIKIKIWWAKLFKKNSNQPDSVKEKPRRPRYDKNERLIWETADRPNWYDN